MRSLWLLGSSRKIIPAPPRTVHGRAACVGRVASRVWRVQLSRAGIAPAMSRASACTSALKARATAGPEGDTSGFSRLNRPVSVGLGETDDVGRIRQLADSLATPSVASSLRTEMLTP